MHVRAPALQGAGADRCVLLAGLLLHACEGIDVASMCYNRGVSLAGLLLRAPEVANTARTFAMEVVVNQHDCCCMQVMALQGHLTS